MKARPARAGRTAASLRVDAVAAPLRQQVHDNLLNAIIEGQFKPGQRLIERELCEMTGVSRTAIREALRQLEAEGLVVNIANRGPMVAEITVEEARDIYQVRSVMEGLAGRLFAQQATKAQLKELQATVADLEQAYRKGDVKDILRLKDRFYGILLDGAGNSVVRSMLQMIHARANVLRSYSLAQADRRAESLKEIERIVEALEARDTEAAWRACVDHVERAASVALKAIDTQPSDRP